MILPTHTCSCGSSELFALRPGVEPARRGAVDIRTGADPLVEAGEPAVAWCLPHWLERFGTVPEAVAS